APRNFKDVRDSVDFAKAVKWVVSAGVANGVSNTSFAPNDTCTRGEILTMLWRANGSPLVESGLSFSDVNGSDFYRNAAAWAGAKGLVTGSRFDGESPCSRGEVVKYLWLLAGSPQPKQACAFVDVPADLASAVAWSVEQGISTGATKQAFEPAVTCTRGQIAAFLYRAYR
ncbi:MAG: S-layer homology domain-containing protein, partial [Firmicutes bacterium]|nr:S-layer homology domain-containing protein [Bacillota bacterium]